MPRRQSASRWTTNRSGSAQSSCGAWETVSWLAFARRTGLGLRAEKLARNRDGISRPFALVVSRNLNLEQAIAPDLPDVSHPSMPGVHARRDVLVIAIHRDFLEGIGQGEGGQDDARVGIALLERLGRHHTARNQFQDGKRHHEKNRASHDDLQQRKRAPRLNEPARAWSWSGLPLEIHHFQCILNFAGSVSMSARPVTTSSQIWRRSFFSEQYRTTFISSHVPLERKCTRPTSASVASSPSVKRPSITTPCGCLTRPDCRACAIRCPPHPCSPTVPAWTSLC